MKDLFTDGGREQSLGRLAALGSPVIDLSSQVIPALIPHIRAVEHHGFFADIGTPEALAQARAAFPEPR